MSYHTKHKSHRIAEGSVCFRAEAQWRGDVKSLSILGAL